MDINQLRAELTKRNIAFATNAGITKLQEKLDAALEAERIEVDRLKAEEASRIAEEAKARQAAGESAAQAAAAGVTASGQTANSDEEQNAPGNPDVTEPAAPAVTSSTAPAGGTSETIYQANEKGYEAYDDGDGEDDNPYPPGSGFAAAWLAGFKQAEHEDDPEIPDHLIAEKVRAGLTREQAVEVLTSQRIHDVTLRV